MDVFGLMMMIIKLMVDIIRPRQMQPIIRHRSRVTAKCQNRILVSLLQFD